MSCSGCQAGPSACVGCSSSPVIVSPAAFVGGGLVGAPLTNAQAREIVRQAWQRVHNALPTESQLNYTQAIALFETGYGRIGQFARLAAQGKFNWGALQRRRNPDGSCPAGSEPGSDSGNARCFLVFQSDIDAAERFIFELTKNPTFAQRTAATLAAMTRGAPEDVANAMKIPAAWYEAPVASYAAAIRNGLRNIQASTPIGSTTGRPPGPMTATSSSILPTILLGTGVGVLGWWLYNKYGKRRRR